MADLHQWVDREGKHWECDAYDHGPFCRQCRPTCSLCGLAVPPLELWQEWFGGELFFGHRECLTMSHPGRSTEVHDV